MIIKNETLACQRCGEPFSQQRAHQKYCSSLCRETVGRDRLREQGLRTKKEISTNSVGAAHELLVCADLLKRGLNVFRAQSPSCPCDLILLVGTRVFRVEVRTGNVAAGKHLSFPFKEKDKGRFDLLAVVLHNGIIHWHDFEAKPVDFDELIGFTSMLKARDT